MPGSGRQEHGADPREEGNSKICEQIQGHPTENGHYGRWPEQSPGTILVQRRGKIYASLPTEMIEGIQNSDMYEKMKKDCKAEEIEIPQQVMAQDQRTHVLTPQEYMKNVQEGKMPPMRNLQELAEKTNQEDRTHFVMMEFRNLSRPNPPKTPSPPEHK